DRVNRVVNVAGGGQATRPLRNMVEFQVPSPERIREHYSRLAAASQGAFSRVELAAPFIAKRELPGHGEAFAKVMRHVTNPSTQQRYNTLRRLPHIKAPTLGIWGRDDAVNSLAELGGPL